MQTRWKYAKPKKMVDFEEFLVLPLDKKFKITVKNWMFSDGNVDGETKIVFRSDVIEMDGKSVNKRIVIKNYENVQELKKALGRKKSIKDTAKLELTRHYSEDILDHYFDIKFLE